MEISSITLSLSRPPPATLHFSSSHSTLFRSCDLLNTRKKFSNTALVLGRRRCRHEASKKGFTCNALFGLGVPELVVIAGVAALVFGPKKLPEVGKSIGKTVKSFQQAAKEFESELKKEDTDSPSEIPGETSTATSEEKKRDVEVSSSKESA